MKQKCRNLLYFVLVISLFFTLLATIHETDAAEKNKITSRTSVAKANETKKNLSAQEVVNEMGVGWNLGNSLDAYSYDLGFVTPEKTEKLWGNPIVTKKLIDTVADAGFGAIRIPVTYVNHIDSDGKIDSAWLKRIGQVVQYGLDNDLYVIINVHHDTGNQGWIYADKTTYETDLKNFLNIWRQVAKYFKDYDNKLLFQSTNEILNRDKSWDWGKSWDDFRVVHDMSQEFIDLVRQTGSNNKTRYLVLSTWGASSDSAQVEHMFYKKFTDTVSDRLILSVHNYMSSKTSIQKVIASLESYSEKYDIPIIIDEFGTTAGVVMEQRITSAKCYVKTAKKAGIACFWWDNGGDYSILNRQTYQWRNQKLVDALIKSAE